MIRWESPEVGQDRDSSSSSSNDNDRSPDHNCVGDVDEHDALEEKSEEPDGVQEGEESLEKPQAVQEVKISPEEPHGVREDKGRHEESDDVQERKGSYEETGGMETAEFSKLTQDEPEVLEGKEKEPDEGVQEEKERAGGSDGVAQEGSLEERRVHVKVGPLWNNDHAAKVGRCYELEHPGTRWGGGWNTTVWCKMSVLFITISPDTTRMQDAIQSGRGEPVDALLQGINEQHQKAQLRANYGGSPDIPGDPDKNGLYVRTSPMLHAARCGNIKAFCLLLRFTRKLLETELKTIIKAHDRSGRTVLAMAALSGKGETVNIVLDEVEKALDPTEVVAMLRTKDSRGRSLLALAAEGAAEDTFQAVRECLEQKLPKEELETMTKTTDENGCTVLAMVAKGKKSIFDTVLTAVKKDLNPSEVVTMLRTKDSRGRSLLALAAEGAAEDTFQAVRECLEQKLPKEEVGWYFKR